MPEVWYNETLQNLLIELQKIKTAVSFSNHPPIYSLHLKIIEESAAIDSVGVLELLTQEPNYLVYL